MQVTPFTCRVGEDVWFAIFARNVAGNLIQDASTQVDCKVEGDHSATPTYDQTDIGTVYDTPIEGDARWRDDCNLDAADRDKYNFDHIVPASAFPVAAMYRVTFTITSETYVMKHVFDGPAEG